MSSQQDVLCTHVIDAIDTDITLTSDALLYPQDSFTTFFTTAAWTAQKTGTVLVKWYHPGVTVVHSGPSPEGDLGFSIRMNGVQGSFETLRSMKNIARLHDDHHVHAHRYDQQQFH